MTQRKTIFYSLQPQGGGKEKGKECCKEGELEHTGWKKRTWGDRNLCLSQLLSPTGIHFTEASSCLSVSKADRSCLIKPWTDHGCKFAKLIPIILTLEDFILINILNI